MNSTHFPSIPLESDRLTLVVRKALEQQRRNGSAEVLSEKVEERHRFIVGESAEMELAVDLAKKAACSSATVLLLGESGTGKEIFARAIHNWSERKDRPFIAINSVGLSKELLESELFGHEQGSFTGAHRRKTGKIELAHGGTIFFDEIGDVSQELQAKLLRFLQEREFERVGGVTPISVDVRIIAATNRNLERSVKEGRFRADLYYRFNVVAINLPPLRERREDIAALSQYFLRKQSAEVGRNITGISKEAQARLEAYDWPGNVRELANVIERAVVLGAGPTVTLEDLPGWIAAGWTTPALALESQSYREGLNAAKKQLISKALATTNGNRSAAAKILGIEAKYLLRLMKSFHIK
jgi:transcriptional regulator with PAS, ATPase and Fis domain